MKHDTVMRGVKLALFALGVSASAAGAQTPTDVLVIGKSEDPRTIDPAVTMSNNAWSVTYPAYERLVTYKTKDGKGLTKVEGQLASSWEVSDDNLVWTFTLEDGHAFADGSPVTAEAVVYSFERLLEMGQGPSGAFPTVDSIEAEGDMTVKFTLEEAFAPFINTLAVNGAAIVNPKAAEHEEDGDLAQGYLSGHTMGSGAFTVESWEKGQSIVMVPNEHYAGDEPAFSRVEIRIIKEASARRLQLENGDLDIAENLPVDQIKAVKSSDGVTVGDWPSFSVTYLYLNNEKAPLDDPKVRGAVAQAIDYDSIVEGILLGNAIRMRGPIPKGMWGYDKSLDMAQFDTAAAAKAIEEAGLKGSKLGYLYATNDPNWEPVGLAVQAYLQQAGIEVEMQQYAYATMRDRLDRGEFDIAIGNWSPDFSDPYMFMNYWFDSKRHGLPGNRSYYTNEKVDELIHKAARISDQSEREKLYQEAQKLVMEDNAYVYLFQKNYQLPMRSNVEGYVYNPMLLDIYNIATMSKK